MIDRKPLIGSFGRALRIGAALVAVALMLAPRAHADPVGNGVLTQASMLVAGSSATVYSMDVNGPGLLTVRLENIAWPERLAKLDCSIYSDGGLLQALDGGGVWKLETSGPMSFYASVLAGAGGQLKLGLYSLKVTFEAGASLVPVPAAVWLLGSVLGIFGLRRAWPVVRFSLAAERLA